MKAYEIPLTPEAQIFTIALAGRSYQLKLVWNILTACWILDISTPAGAPIVQGIPIVTGLDLLAQYGYLLFGGGLMAQTDGSTNIEVQFDGFATPGAGADPGPQMQANIFPNDVPTFTNLGIAGRLYFVVP